MKQHHGGERLAGWAMEMKRISNELRPNWCNFMECLDMTESKEYKDFNLFDPAVTIYQAPR